MKIGIFDSGLGGLTVAREIKKKYPGHSIIYIGDTERIPWGVRSPRVIKKFSLELLRFLGKKRVDLVVVACHTASSVAIPTLKRSTKVPVYGVIEPAAEAAAKVSRGRVGILGTPATTRSGAWEKAVKKRNNNLITCARSAPLLVPIVEEGLENHSVAKAMVYEYTKPLLARQIDTLVLACTHYPLLEDVFREVVGGKVKLVNPGVEFARHPEFISGARGIPKRVRNDNDGRDEFYFTDLSDRVKERLSGFYGRKVSGIVKEVRIEE